MTTERHEFNRITFALPAQSFKFSAFISTEERLPAVTEFVLRLLHTCGGVSLAALRDYFGFSEAEALSVVEALDRQGYVTLDGNTLALSATTLEQFDKSPDACPWVKKLKKRIDVVPFDLLAFTPLRRTDFAFATANWVKLNPPDDMLGNSISRARQAYRESFGQIERDRARAWGEERERSHGVHSISDIEARRPTFIPLTLTMSVDQSGRLITALPEEFETGAKVELLRTVRERIAEEFEKNPMVKDDRLSEFVDLFQLDFLRPYVTGGTLDVVRYASAVQNRLEAPSGIEPLFGSLYLSHNIQNVGFHISEARSGRRGAPKHLSSIAWLAPDYEFWGRGQDFRSAVETLAKAIKLGSPGDDIYLLDYAEERQEQSVKSKYSETGVLELHLLRPDRAAGKKWLNALELMLYPGQFAVAMIHVQLEGCPGVCASIGILTKSAVHLQLVHRLLMNGGRGNRYAGRWSFRKQSPKSEAPGSFSEALRFLDYSDLSPRALLNGD